MSKNGSQGRRFDLHGGRSQKYSLLYVNISQWISCQKLILNHYCIFMSQLTFKGGDIMTACYYESSAILLHA